MITKIFFIFSTICALEIELSVFLSQFHRGSKDVLYTEKFKEYLFLAPEWYLCSFNFQPLTPPLPTFFRFLVYRFRKSVPEVFGHDGSEFDIRLRLAEVFMRHFYRGIVNIYQD